MKILQAAGVAAILGLGSFSAQAATIDFESFNNGDNVTSVGYGFGTMNVTGVTGGIGQAWAYDSNVQSPTNGDPDLDGPVFVDNGGNQKSLGNILIIQEDNGDNRRPDDNGRGGTISLDFTSTVKLVSIDVVDMPLGSFTISLFDSLDNSLGIFNNLENTETTGNQNGLNMFETLYFGDLSGVSRMDLSLRHSGAIDNIVVSNVPLPAAAWLFGSALIGFAGFKRFKK